MTKLVSAANPRRIGNIAEAAAPPASLNRLRRVSAEGRSFCMARLRLSLFDEPVKFCVVQVNNVEPDLEHVINAPLSEPRPYGGVRIVRIRGCVVMDTDHVQHRARRQQGRGLVRIDVVDVPVEIEMIYGAQDFSG